MIRPALRLNQISLCSLHTAAKTDGKKNQMISLSAKRGQLTKVVRDVRISLMKRQKRTESKEQIIAEHPNGLQWSNFCDFEKLSRPKRA